MIMKKTQLFLIKFFGLQNIDNNRWPWTKMTFYSTHFPSSHQRRSLESRRRSFLNCPSSQTKYVSNYGIFFFQCSPFISSANPLTTLIPQHPIAPVLWLNQTNSKWCYFSSISTSTCTGVDDNHFVNMENCFPRGARMPSCCEIRLASGLPLARKMERKQQSHYWLLHLLHTNTERTGCRRGTRIKTSIMSLTVSVDTLMVVGTELVATENIILDDEVGGSFFYKYCNWSWKTCLKSLMN